jgi:hypothetical protein
MTAPTLFAFRELGAAGSADEQIKKAADVLREGGATWLRATIINDEYPKPPYPHGLYIEGWLVRPDEEPEFNFPLTVAGQ